MSSCTFRYTSECMCVCSNYGCLCTYVWRVRVDFCVCVSLYVTVCVCLCCFILRWALDGCRDLLPSRSRLRGDFLRVPTGLLVHKPGVACPNKHVEVAKHLKGCREKKNRWIILKTPVIKEDCLIKGQLKDHIVWGEESRDCKSGCLMFNLSLQAQIFSNYLFFIGQITKSLRGDDL